MWEVIFNSEMSFFFFFKLILRWRLLSFDLGTCSWNVERSCQFLGGASTIMASEVEGEMWMKPIPILTTWQCLNEHLQIGSQNANVITSPHLFLHLFPSCQFLALFCLISESESCFLEQEIRSWSHSTGQSNREVTRATGNSYLLILYIYLLYII